MKNILTQENIEKLLNYMEVLGIKRNKIKDKALLLKAFIHKSFAADYIKSNIQYNERLEFLGDSILGAIIAKLLFLEYTDYRESELTLNKISLIREETLANVAKEINLNEMIFLGKGEDKAGGRDKDAILADCIEAVIGYIYLDIGIDEVEKFIKKFIYSKIGNLKNVSIKSNKSILQEIIQKKYKILPEYIDYEAEIDEKGNVISYKSQVLIKSKIVAEGFGSSKKKAQEDAAKKVIKKIDNN